jgi:hypothetical protein
MASKKILSGNSVSVLVSILFLFSCSKESNPPVPPADPCAGKTIVITTASAASSPCGNSGSVTVSATGSTGFVFKLNSSGVYQASGTFNGVAAGSYTLFVKDAEGCEKTKSVTVSGTGTAGPKFTAVKNLMSGTCQPCHNNTTQNGGMNWANQCNIIQFQGRIKVRAVDEGTMPQGGPELSPTQKAIITDWIAAGGRFED